MGSFSPGPIWFLECHQRGESTKIWTVWTDAATVISRETHGNYWKTTIIMLLQCAVKISKE